MSHYLIETVNIKKLWGYRDIGLNFNHDVNILIGPNGSGKTTILNLLHSILSLDLRGVLDIGFDEIIIKLRAVASDSVRTVKAKADFEERKLQLSVGKRSTSLDIDSLLGRRPQSYRLHPETGQVVRRMPRRPPPVRGKILDLITDSVSIIWLPVSRRLPETDSEEEQYLRTDYVEWVDLRLNNLCRSLSQYHSRLNAQLSERYKEFEHQVLSAMLYSKEHDQLNSILNSIPSSLPTETEKNQLIGAFEAAGLLDRKMRVRINEHFAAAEEVSKRIGESRNALTVEDIPVLPLISRTKLMVEYARELEKDREHIFTPLRLYEKTVDSFLNDKSVRVDESGNLKIESTSSSDLDTHLLSSGEKQILILLTQALMRIDEPVVYIADEPELSLHVSWQEKLLESLVTLGGQKQVIVATHSPDIVGRFREKIIDLGRSS